MSMIQGVCGVAVAAAVLLILARILSIFGGVGRVELGIMLVPAVLAGIWAGRRVGAHFRQV